MDARDLPVQRADNRRQQALQAAAAPFLLATGTGLAPFLSLIRDPDVYERFEKVVLVHGTRKVDELAYADLIAHDLPKSDHLGELVREKLLYYPAVTREPFRNSGRITDLMVSGKLFADIGLPAMSVENDRFMLCGSPEMIRDTRDLLTGGGYEEGNHGEAGHYVIEKAFVEK